MQRTIDGRDDGRAVDRRVTAVTTPRKSAVRNGGHQVRVAAPDDAAPSVQHVAHRRAPATIEGTTASDHGDDVEDRVQQLRSLAGRVAADYLRLAESLYIEHTAELWQDVRTSDGGRYQSEEDFWENELGVRRRTAFQLIAVGRVLDRLTLSAADRVSLSSVGLYKTDTLVPILERQTSTAGARYWIEVAQSNTREDLRTKVNTALDRPPRRRSASGERVRAFVINSMPDLETRELAIEFFDVGSLYTDSPNALAVLIAGLQEALGTWKPHVEEAKIQHGTGADRG